MDELLDPDMFTNATVAPAPDLSLDELIAAMDRLPKAKPPHETRMHPTTIAGLPRSEADEFTVAAFYGIVLWPDETVPIGEWREGPPIAERIRREAEIPFRLRPLIEFA